LLQRLDPLIEVFVDRYFFGNRYSYLVAFQALTRERWQNAPLAEFLPFLAHTIVQRATTQSCSILLHLDGLSSRPGFKATRHADPARAGSEPSWDDQTVTMLMALFSDGKPSLSRDDRTELPVPLAAIPVEFFEAVVPLKKSGILFGVILLGPK